jgi:uncharacterized membrane protein
MNDHHPWGPRGFDLAPAYSSHHGGPPALAWATFALVLLLALAFFAAAVSLLAARRRPFALAGPRRGRDPLETLRIRYARGELSRDEFLQAASDLTSEGPPSDRG